MSNEHDKLEKPQDELSEHELKQVSGGHSPAPIGQGIGAKSAEDNEQRSVIFSPPFLGGVTVAVADVND